MVKKILITGNMGYVGSVLVKFLRNSFPKIHLTGLDVGFFSGLLTEGNIIPEVYIDNQIFLDIRDINESFFQENKFDSIIHLAAISNDPIGNAFEDVTKEINLDASKNLLDLSVKYKIKNFVFASSCSMYGSGGEESKTEDDITNPLTEYARSKINFENYANQIDKKDTNFISLRFATACGASPRIRLDLVLNDFVTNAVITKKIDVLSDGSPWRPLIDVEDMARALSWAALNTHDDKSLIMNVGSNENNYRIIELTNIIKKIIPEIHISINKNAMPDKRSYRVNFTKFKKITPLNTPKKSIQNTIKELINVVQKQKFVDHKFRETNYMRLNALNTLVKNNILDQNLRKIIK